MQSSVEWLAFTACSDQGVRLYELLAGEFTALSPWQWRSGNAVSGRAAWASSDENRSRSRRNTQRGSSTDEYGSLSYEK
jgi:hypothetical protein